MKLTNQEAIEQLKLNNPFMAGKEKELFSQAIDKGIEALENQKSVIEELEKIKAEIGEAYSYFDSADVHWGFNICRDIIDTRIKELKGENK